MTPQRLFGFLAAWSVLLVLVCLTLVSYAQFRSRAGSSVPATRPAVLAELPVTPALSLAADARAWAVYDPATGQLIAGKNEDEVLPVASITKLVTLLRTRSLPANQVVELEAAHTLLPPAEVGYAQGERALIGDLRAATAVASANDAAAALGALASAEDFALLLPEADSTGLSAKNTASARTVAQLLDLAWRSPSVQPFLGLATTSVPRATGSQVLNTTNRLHDVLRNETVLGGKTGYTNEAGFCLVERFRSGNQELIVVVLGSGANTRLAAAQQVLDLATAAFTQLELASP